MMVNVRTSLWYSSIFLKCLSFPSPPAKASNLNKAISFAHFSFVIFTAISFNLQIFIYIVQNSTAGSSFIIENVGMQVYFKTVTIQLDCTFIAFIRQIFQIAFARVIGKLTMYKIHEKKFFKLLNSMVKNGSLELKTNLENFGHIGNVIYLVYTFTIFSIAIDMCLMPLFEAVQDLPVAAWYPFDYKESTFLYSVAYFHQISAFAIGWLCIGMDIMFGIFVYDCCARYNSMKQMIRELNNTENDHRGTKTRDKTAEKSVTQFEKKMAKLVELHCEVFGSMKDINDLYTWILFVFLLTSAIMICCAGFIITNGSKQSINSQIIFSGMICCVLLDSLFYFLPGDMLAQEAKTLGMEAYCYSNWESMPPEYRKYVLLIILRSSETPKLTAADVTPLTLESYGTFLATTVSYFTSLRAVAGDD